MHESAPQNPEPVSYPSSFLEEQEQLNQKYANKYSMDYEVPAWLSKVYDPKSYDLNEMGDSAQSIAHETPNATAEAATKQGKIKTFMGKIASKFTVSIDLTGGYEPDYKNDAYAGLDKALSNPDAGAAAFFGGDNKIAAVEPATLNPFLTTNTNGGWEKLTLMGANKTIAETEATPAQAEPDAYTVEDTYHKDVTDKTEYTRDAPIAELMNGRGFARRAPRFADQVEDRTRTNKIVSVARTRDAYGTGTGSAKKIRTVTERQALSEVRDFLEEATPNLNRYTKPKAQSLIENMTFIGKKEYDEATAGIAEYWRSELRENPSKQICILVNKIDPSMVKSDAYLLNNIIKNFGDDELAEFAGRIVTDPADLTAKPEDSDVILLDDWVISGSQMATASRDVTNQYPDLAKRLQIQLIAAGKSKIDTGLDLFTGYGSNEMSNAIPIKAYFLAHGVKSSEAPHSGAHITGAHCAVDYDYNNLMSNIAQKVGKDMPAGTNIVRPYRMKGAKLDEINRLQRAVPARAGQTVRMSALTPDVIAAMDNEFYEKHGVS